MRYRWNVISAMRADDWRTRQPGTPRWKSSGAMLSSAWEIEPPLSVERRDAPDAIATALAGRRFIDAEFMYKPRPERGRARIVFDFALRSRLSALSSADAALFICDSQATIDSLEPLAAEFPHLPAAYAVANPQPWSGPSADTPRQLQWESAGRWRRYAMTDRWARIDFALHVGSLLKNPGWLVMPAHDAVWGRELLPRLAQFGERHARQGLPAAVSPCTYHQHSPVEGAHIPRDVIDLLNTAFGRDSLFGWKVRFDQVQAFWGKMGMLPFGMCKSVQAQAEKFVWEDDLEIDRVIREAGYGVRGLWVRDPQLYRQALPVSDRDGVRRVIERTLHYSLNVPTQDAGASTLNFPLGPLGKMRRVINPRFRRCNEQAEALIAECTHEIRSRLQRFGASWVDWGAYRYVMRVGDPMVEVWKNTTLAQD